MNMYDNKYLAFSIIYILAGAALTGLTMAGILSDPFYESMGVILLVIGVLRILRVIKYRNNAEYREKIDTAFNDERNRFLQMKSWSYAGQIVVFLECIGMIAATILGQETILNALSYSVCLLLIAYWVSYLILSRKY